MCEKNDLCTKSFPTIVSACFETCYSQRFPNCKIPQSMPKLTAALKANLNMKNSILMACYQWKFSQRNKLSNGRFGLHWSWIVVEIDDVTVCLVQVRCFVPLDFFSTHISMYSYDENNHYWWSVWVVKSIGWHVMKGWKLYQMVESCIKSLGTNFNLYARR